MEMLLNENQKLKEKLVMKFQNVGEKQEPLASSKLLQLLIDCAMRNAGKKPNGFRYSEDMKEVATLIYLLGGVQCFNFFSENMAFPGFSTVRKCLYSADLIKEGEFRFADLSKFLKGNNLPNKIFVSEDATKIAARIQYHGKTNEVVGFTLPLDGHGLPMKGNFPALSAKTMSEYFNTSETSNFAYCIIAQAIGLKAPSFVLCFFGTNNKFDASQVEKRWVWMQSEAEKHGIEIVGYSSDGDTRLLKTMTYRTLRSDPAHSWKWFQAEKKTEQFCIEDHIHAGTKLKSRLCKPSVILPLGKEHIVSRGHLITLIENVSKDQHNLCVSDINCKDKMNFRAVQKVCDEKVRALLRSEVCNSEGTATYLDMVHDILRTFTDQQLLPLERVEMIWVWVFFLRMWRAWLLQEKGYTLQHNFVSANSYTCIELNAHGLIQAIIKFRDAEEHHLFLPWLMSSQPSEEYFRALRSTRTTHCGVVSFSILELQNRIRRIEFLTSKFKKLGNDYVFKRHHKSFQEASSKYHVPVCLPEDYEIEAAVLSALQKAIHIAAKLKLIKRPGPKFMPTCQLSLVTERAMHGTSTNSQEECEDDDDDCDCQTCAANEGEAGPSDDEDDEDLCDDSADVEEDLFLVSTGSLGVKSFNNVNLTEKSPYVKVVDANGKVSLIKKSTFLYLHTSGKVSTSSDRILRYQAANVDHRMSSSRKPFFAGLISPTKENSVNLADWCAFRNEDGSVVVGLVLAFSYLSGSTWSDQEYSLPSAPVKAPKKNARGVGCLCSWFKITKNRILTSMDMDIQGYYSIDHYLCTLPKPKIRGGHLTLMCSVTDILKC